MKHKLREIALDTETTGLSPVEGHRIVEIAAIEIINCVPTGAVFHQYINPERDMPAEAFRVHGLSRDFLSDYPTFDKVVDGFLSFIGNAPLVIHNADFDMRFLNAELVKLGYPMLSPERAVDTLKIARKKFPGAKVNLDALCKRFNIDNSNRVKHGALLDTELLVEVYVELKGGKQPSLKLDSQQAARLSSSPSPLRTQVSVPSSFLVTEPLAAELEAHEAMLQGITDPIWKRNL